MGSMTIGNSDGPATVACYIECACGDRLEFKQETVHPSFGQTGGHVLFALDLAATYLGWRKTMGEWARYWCPFCADKHRIVCERCKTRVCGCSRPRIEGVRAP